MSTTTYLFLGEIRKMQTVFYLKKKNTKKKKKHKKKQKNTPYMELCGPDFLPGSTIPENTHCLDLAMASLVELYIVDL